jgi:hypothetical protein
MELLIPIARENTSEKLVFVDEVPGGIDCNCRCIFCDVRLIARKGDVVTHHFAHYAKEVDEDKPCPASFERAVFWMVRSILEDNQSVFLPGIDERRQEPSLNLDKEYSLKEQSMAYNKITYPDHQIDRYSDTALLESDENSVLLRFYCSEKYKLPRLALDLVNVPNRACLGIYLGSLYEIFSKQNDRFRATLEEYVLGDMGNKRWLYHPFEKECAIDFNQLISAGMKKKTVSRKEEAMARFRQKMKDSGF